LELKDTHQEKTLITKHNFPSSLNASHHNKEIITTYKPLIYNTVQSFLKLEDGASQTKKKNPIG
jgi:hypothetical protein